MAAQHDTQAALAEKQAVAPVDEKMDFEPDSKNVENSAVRMPASIAGMSDAEIEAMRKKMVRKMDLVIMPCMGLLYILNYVDRSALAATKVYGIMEDLNMNSQQFATAIAILFVGYLPFQIPSNMVMTYISRPGLYLCCACMVWGTVSACTAAVQNYASLLVVRVFLGVTEAVFFPGIIYFLSAWYAKQELGKRLAALFMFQMIGNAFGGLIAAGVLTLNGRHGIAGWRWLFIVEGAITVGVGALCALVMPEYPHNARLLKPIERDYAVWRLEKEAGVGEAHEDISNMQGFKKAFMDPKIWTLVACMSMSQAMGSIMNFFPSIVNTLGYPQIETLLLTTPPFFLGAIVFYGLSWWSDRKDGHMYNIIMGLLAVSAVAFAVALGTTATGPRYFAMMLLPFSCVGPQIMLYKTLNLHMARPYQKRAAGVAMLNGIGGLSNIWSSYLWYDAPRYYAAFGCLLGCATVIVAVLTAYRFHVRKLNRLLDGTPEEQQRTLKSGVTQQQLDLNWRFVGY